MPIFHKKIHVSRNSAAAFCKAPCDICPTSRSSSRKVQPSLMRTFFFRFLTVQLVLALFVLTFASPAHADELPPDTAQTAAEDPVPERALSPREKKIADVMKSLVWQIGPKALTLKAGASIALPEGYHYIDAVQATRVQEAFGHIHNESLQGMIRSAGEEPWTVYIDYFDEGYVKDDEKVDADELLKSIREGQDEANTERVKQGHPALRIIGWGEAPRYERTNHHLVWGVNVKEDGDDENSINYNTRILGRKGILSLNLVTSTSELAAHKPRVETLLNVTKFPTGARYEDFDAKTDKVAEYGLAGLVLGGAGIGAAKLLAKGGLIALFAKGGKGLIALLAAPALALKRFFAKKSE
jgi:uncharacterized membrane-anchored protein